MRLIDIMKTKLHTFFAVAVLSMFSASSLAAPNSEEVETNQPIAAPTQVVELFTSQGCSSCPPANKFVGQIAEQDGVLALTYGVTYWDYLGWKDTFGDPSFTKRQREYRQVLGTSNIYTPQIILNGAKHGARFAQRDVLSTQMPDNGMTSRILIKNGTLSIEGDAPKGSVVAVVSYMPGVHDVAVKRGENGGRNLRLTNVVTDVTKMPWKGETISTKIKAETGMAYAALFHGPETGQIITAATYAP
ncbi:MAG: DUF1223 domain-containing protein [Litorimonas sp.]